MLSRFLLIVVFLPLVIFAAPPELPQSPTIPTIDLTLTAPNEPGDLVAILNIVIVLTLLVLAPSLVLMATSFARILIVFSFLRTAMGTQQSPPTQLLVSFALILTMFIMEPVVKEGYEKGVKPYVAKEISYQEAFVRASQPFKDFMIRNTRPKDLALFYRIRGMENPQNAQEVPFTIALPAFIISEMKTAFQIGFFIFLPFLVIDIVISSFLRAIGMVMFQPTWIYLPF